LVYHAKP